MKRFMLCLFLLPLAVMAQTPSYPVRLDLQSPSRTFTLKWAAGSSPLLSAYVSDGGRAYTNLTGWTGYVYVAVTPTAGVYVAASPVGSNRVNFSFTASQTATVGTFGVEVVLGNGTNTYRWGTGTLALSNSPALLGAGTVPLTGVFNWDLYTFTGTQPPLTASYTNPLAGDVTGVPGATVIGDGAVGTNNLDAETRGLLGNHTTNGYAVNGQNITGRWFAVGNTNTGAGGFSFLGGGAGNKLQGTVAVIVGGQNNYIDANGLGGFIGGGRENSIYGQYTVIGGGEGNTASFTGQRSFIGGGYYNSSVGFYGSIGGGKNNNITGDYGTIPGGYNNEASSNSFAVGVGARATNAGSFVVSLPGDTNATFSSRGDNTFNVRSVGGTYFLSPDFWIQDTNGNTIARFSATNTTISGSLNLTGYATTQQVADAVSSGNVARLGGYLPTDFALLTTLSTGGYLRITSGAVTSNSAAGTRGEYRRSTTNAYFHDGSQWVTWVVSTNFSH